MKKNNTEAGFSLFELLVVIFILSVILVAIASNMGKTVKVLWENKSRSTAVNLAQNCIEDFNFNNSWRDWTDFYRSSLSEYCLFGTTGLRCGSPQNDMCNADRLMPEDWAGRAVANNPIETTPPNVSQGVRPTLNTSFELTNANKELTSSRVFFDNVAMKATSTKRVYYDLKSTTGYEFVVSKYPADVYYVESIKTLPGETSKGVWKTRQAVVIVVDVSWEKFGAEASNLNKYQVAKQYMAER